MPTDADNQPQPGQPEQDKQLHDLQNQKALLDAQKALADSRKALDLLKDASAQQLADLVNQKALLDAQKALADSQKALDQAKDSSAQRLLELQNQKALADAQKSLADAQTQAALARLIGDVKAGPFAGTVDMKEKAGTEEAALLVARAVRESAKTVADAVRPVLPKDKDVFIFNAKELPTFQNLRGFQFRVELLLRAFGAVNVQLAAARPEDAVALPALVSAGLDALNKLLGFFKTDFTIGGADVKVDALLLLYAVAGQLPRARLPLTYDPAAGSDAVAKLTDEPRFKKLSQLRAAAASSSADNVKAVVGMYDAFISSLTTPDTAGNLPLAGVAGELAISEALKTGCALLLHLESSGGGFLVKKNLWTGLGAMPLFHMGGATVAYALLDGATGNVLKGDIVPVHGGFLRSDEIRATLIADRT